MIYNGNHDDKNGFGAIEYNENGNPVGGYKEFSLFGKEIIQDGDVEGIFSDDAQVTFYFEDDGSIEIRTNTDIWIHPYTDISKFLKDLTGCPPLSIMTPEMISYYTNLEPLVPNF